MDKWEELFDFQYRYRTDNNITAYRMTIILNIDTKYEIYLHDKKYTSLKNMHLIKLYEALNIFKQNITKFDIGPFVEDINNVIEIKNNIESIKLELNIDNCKINYNEENNILDVRIFDAKFEEKYTKERINKIIKKHIIKPIEINLIYLEYL